MKVARVKKGKTTPHSLKAWEKSTNHKRLLITLGAVLIVSGVGLTTFWTLDRQITSATDEPSNAQIAMMANDNPANPNTSANPSTDRPSISSAPSPGSSPTNAFSGTAPTQPAPQISVGNTALNVNNSNVSMGCGQSFTFEFTGTITATAPGTITYHWLKTDLGDSGSINLTFESAGTKTVTTSWTFNASETSHFDGTVRLETLTPNTISKLQTFHFTGTCL